MNQNAAIYYKPDGYNTKGKRLMGRHSAGEGFLKAFVQSQNVDDTLYCYGANQQDFNHFKTLTSSWLINDQNYQLIPFSNSEYLAQVGNLYLPGPSLPDFAWQRRYNDQRGYSICGVTHTIASKEMVGNISRLITAPIQPWDALICTSSAVKVAVDKIIDDWQEYLGKRFNTTVNVPLKLPIIPLGVEKDKFKHNPQSRDKLRQQLNIAPDDIVVLFLGRLIFYGKAHPVPMYLALEKAFHQRQTKQKIHLIQCGWFEESREEKAFTEGAVTFSPSINHIFLDGRDPQIKEQIWSCADIFISLADNIQETFGLTPIEAMAASLPVVVSDWNGYKESVRHEIDGFRISTVIPQTNNALDLASYYHNDEYNYSCFMAHTCLTTIVDVDECATALVKLIDNPELRKQMGKNGRERVEQIYDWQKVILAYRQLWQELAMIRNVEAMSVPVQKNNSVNPLCDDPFNLFAHYTTRSIDFSSTIKLGAMATEKSLKEIRLNWTTSFGHQSRLSDHLIDQIIEDVKSNQTLNLGYFIGKYGQKQPHLLIRTILYLGKFDILKISS